MVDHFMDVDHNKLIGLGGLLRSGKDTVADYLVEKHGYAKIGMSDALRDFLVAQNPIIAVENEADVIENEDGSLAVNVQYVRFADYLDAVGYVKAKELPEFRSIMQRTGTEAGRNVLGNDVWVDAVKKKIYDYWDQGQSVVVTGIRYSNEIDLIRYLDGLSVWVERSAVRQSETLTPLDESMRRHPAGKRLQQAHSASGHSSETSLSPDEFDDILNNDHSLSSLYALVDAQLLTYG